MRAPVLVGALFSLALLASSASAQQAPAKDPSPAAASADPPPGPAYDPAAHGGMPYGTYLRATHGRGLQSPGMMVVGILLVGLGNVMMGVGTAVYASAGCSDEVTPEDGVTPCSKTGGHTAGMGILIAGTLGTAIGVPLWILGGTAVPRVEAASVPELRVGPRGATLSWSF